MNLDTFFEKFDEFADAPNAVAKMRGVILRLAMQGGLSEPHNADDPVNELLRDVEEDKIRLGVTHSTKATNDNSDCSANESTDALPARWKWVRFGSIARHNAGKTLDKGRNRGELQDYLTTSNLYWGVFKLDAVRQMPIMDDELDRCTAIKGDLLICEGGEAGRAAVWPHDREISFQNHVHRARFFAGINPYFVQRYFEKLNATGEIEKYRKGVGISNMSGKALASIPIPLPPLAEQKRIVAKVDELMALCDQLETQQQERDKKHTALARASLARFADAPTPANLPFLFQTSYAISPADLRRSILTLAVQGKLVPQDPNDEPAQTLLDRIAAHKADLAKDGKLRGPTSVKPIGDDETTFELPSNWCWVRFGAIMVNRDGERIPVSKEQRETKKKTYDYYGASGVIDKIDGYLFDKPLLLIGEDGANLINRSTPIAFIARGKYWVNNHAHVLDGISEDFLQFIELHINAINLEKYVTGSAQPKMNQAKMNSIPIALPPLAEQRRIVAKVEQLMALVDSLETQLASSRATAANLVEAVVAELSAQA